MGIVKVVYFDEGSATDYVQVHEGGELSNVMMLIDEDANSGEAGASAKIGVKAKLLRALAGIDAAAGVDAGIRASFNSGTVVKSIISNTVLTDFLNVVDASSQEAPGAQAGYMAIQRFSNLRIEQIPGSISTMALLTPYFSMLRSGQSIAAGEFDIALDKLDGALSKAKGYFEFCGVREPDDKGDGGDERVIFRFNSDAFKNNYRPSDLLKMNLSLFAVKVGSAKLSALSANQELEFRGFDAKDNPDYGTSVEFSADAEEELDMYDVVLAGVSADDK